VDAFTAEQNEAADMHARQQRDRCSLIEADDEIRRIAHHQIHVAARQLLGGVAGRGRLIDKANIGEALRLQQLLWNHLRHSADCGVPREFNGRGL
jgi:hypothetical protein